MGMSYKECSKCKGCIGIMGQYVGFIKCEDCKNWIQEDTDSMFKRHRVQCPKCGFTVSFQSMDEHEDCRCIKCDCKMESRHT